MKKMTQYTIGIDVSKDFLDAACLPDAGKKSYERFTNDRAGLKKLAAWIKRRPLKMAVFEATGIYHRDLENFLDKSGIPFSKVNPRRVRNFAKATGRAAKTDKIDAFMLARFGIALEPPLCKAKSPALQELHELLNAKAALIKERTALKNRQKILTSSLLKKQAEKRLKRIEEELKAITAACMEIVKKDDDLDGKMKILVSVPGIAEATALTMLVEMPELGDLDKRQAASLAGLAPTTNESGRRKGKSFIQGGRRFLRCALYMPALVACRFNPVLKAKYDALIALGKPAKVAIVAVMRKLITIANALVRDNRKWS